MKTFLLELRLLKCGNSSGVEHNLAKVGVASSNLVSRSIFFLFLSPFFLFAGVVLEPMYCISGDSITLSVLGPVKQDEEILNLNGSAAAKIKTSELTQILMSKAINFSDKSGGKITFAKNCNELMNMQNAFLRELTRQYPKIIFSKLPEISLQTNTPEKLNEYFFEKLSVNSISSQNGIFRAIFRFNDLQKTLFFKYSFKAQMPALRAVKNIPIKHTLGLLDYQIETVNFDDFKHDLITSVPSSKLIAKRNIKAGEFLSVQFFNAQTLIRKGDKIAALLNDGQLSITIEVKAAEHGNLGDTIKVVGKDRKIFEATIISKNKAIIR